MARPLIASAALFFEENWKGLLVVGGFCAVGLAGFIVWIRSEAQRELSYERLVAEGERVTGTIVECEFLPGQRPIHVVSPEYDWSQLNIEGQEPAVRAQIDYYNPSGDRLRSQERWSLLDRSGCAKGQPVTMYYLPDNPYVTVASVHAIQVWSASRRLEERSRQE